MREKNNHPIHSIIIPAYNEADVIFNVLIRIREVMDNSGTPYEILVVDDGSADDTAAEAIKAGAKVIKHPYNIGYGAALKTGFRQARGSVVITIDGDGQHDPQDLIHLLGKTTSYDMVVGNRNRNSETDKHRDFANLIFNLFASYVAGQKIEDLTSGLRAMSTKNVRKFLYLLPNKFSCSSTLTLTFLHAGYSLGYVPIKVTRRPGTGKSKIKPFSDGLRFLILIIKIAMFYSPLKIFIPISFLMFTFGVGYGLMRIFVWGVNYGQTSALMISTSVLIFMVGLVSEQIAQLRFSQSEPESISKIDDA